MLEDEKEIEREKRIKFLVNLIGLQILEQRRINRLFYFGCILLVIIFTIAMAYSNVIFN